MVICILKYIFDHAEKNIAVDITRKWNLEFIYQEEVPVLL